MITKTKYLTLLVLISMLGVGCQQDAFVADADLSSVTPEKVVPMVLPPDQNLFNIMTNTELSEDEKSELKEEYGRMQQRQNAANTAILKVSDWKEASEIATKALEEHERSNNMFTSAFRQGIGSTMLSVHLDKGVDTPEKIATLGFYTQMLIDEGHPDGSIMVPALRKLSGEWDQEEMSLAVSKVREASQSFLAKNICVECNKVDTAGEIEDITQRKLYTIDNAVGELETLTLIK